MAACTADSSVLGPCAFPSGTSQCPRKNFLKISVGPSSDKPRHLLVLGSCQILTCLGPKCLTCGQASTSGNQRQCHKSRFMDPRQARLLETVKNSSDAVSSFGISKLCETSAWENCPSCNVPFTRLGQAMCGKPARICEGSISLLLLYDSLCFFISFHLPGYSHTLFLLLSSLFSNINLPFISSLPPTVFSNIYYLLSSFRACFSPQWEYKETYLMILVSILSSQWQCDIG